MCGRTTCSFSFFPLSIDSKCDDNTEFGVISDHHSHFLISNSVSAIALERDYKHLYEERRPINAVN